MSLNQEQMILHIFNQLPTIIDAVQQIPTIVNSIQELQKDVAQLKQDVVDLRNDQFSLRQELKREIRLLREENDQRFKRLEAKVDMIHVQTVRAVEGFSVTKSALCVMHDGLGQEIKKFA